MFYIVEHTYTRIYTPLSLCTHNLRKTRKKKIRRKNAVCSNGDS